MREGLRGDVPGARLLLERDRELELIGRLVDSASAGSGGVVLVEGLPGIGKSSVLRELRAAALGRGHTVMSARGSQLELGFSFGVVRQLFDTHLPIAGAERDELFRGAATLAETVFSDSGDGRPVTDPEFATLHGLFWLVSAFAERGPVAIVIDDLHWTDIGSLHFVSFLANRLEGLPVLVAAATRPPSGRDSEHGGAEVIDALRSEPSVHHVKLRPLSEPATEALVRGRLGADADAAIPGACHQLTGGNPFMLNELLVELGARQADDPVSAEQIAEARPERIIDAVLARIDRLGPDAQALCRALAVLGDRTDAALVVEHAQVGAGAASVTDALARAGILEVGKRTLDFMHPIIRTAVYERIPPFERSEEHLRIARLLRSREYAAEGIASHLLATGAGLDEDWMGAALREAAQTAISRGAPRIAAGYLERAVSEERDPAAKAELLAELALVSLHAGRESVIAELEQALELSDEPAQCAEINFRLAEAHFAGGGALESLQWIDRALEWAEREPSAEELRERCLGMVLGLAIYDPAPRERLRERFDAILALADSDDAPAPALATISAEVAFVRGTAAEAIEIARRAIDGGLVSVATADGIPVYHCAGTLMSCGEARAAARLLADAAADARSRGSVVGLGYATAMQAHAYLSAGRIDDAEGEALAVLNLDLGPLAALTHLLAYTALTTVRIEQGRLDEAERYADLAAGSGVEPEMILFQWLRKALVELRLAQGRIPDARDAVGDLVGWEERWGGATGAWTEALRLSARVRHRLEDPEAIDLARAEVERAERLGAPWHIGAALGTLAEVGPRAEALATRRRALEALEGAESRLHLARARLELGAVLRREGEDREAREHLAAARELVHGLGAVAVEQRILEEFVAAGGRPKVRRGDSLAKLTPAELRVARRAAAGLSNPEIAQELFVTTKTVETHLSRVYRKLEVTTRAQLPSHPALQSVEPPPG